MNIQPIEIFKMKIFDMKYVKYINDPRTRQIYYDKQLNVAHFWPNVELALIDAE